MSSLPKRGKIFAVVAGLTRKKKRRREERRKRERKRRRKRVLCFGRKRSAKYRRDRDDGRLVEVYLMLTMGIILVVVKITSTT